MQYRALARLAGIGILASLLTAQSPAPRAPQSMATKITVYKDPDCDCCTSWIEHLRKHGFDVVANDTRDMSAPKRTGRVPEQLRTCHTAFVNGYVVEGHVPAADIQRMLKEKPKIAGIAVPGMPAGSPGMEVGNKKDKYDVIAFARDGRTSVYARR